jgi:hypothetical protein
VVPRGQWARSQFSRPRWDRGRITALGLVAVAVAVVAPACAAPTCPASKPEVTIGISVAEPIIDNALPQLKLQRLAGQQHHYGRTQGLYQADLEVGWRARFRRSDADGETCGWVDHVTVTLTMPRRVIYIVRERHPGTCPYESVLAHERKHQAVDEAVVAEHIPRLQQAAKDAAALPRIETPEADGEAMKALLTEPIAAALKREFAALAKARTERQAAVDTPDEYRRVRAACG